MNESVEFIVLDSITPGAEDIKIRIPSRDGDQSCKWKVLSALLRTEQPGDEELTVFISLPKDLRRMPVNKVPIFAIRVGENKNSFEASPQFDISLFGHMEVIVDFKGYTASRGAVTLVLTLSTE